MTSKQPVTTRRIVTDPANIRKAIHDGVLAELKDKFPIEGRQYRAELQDIRIEHKPLTHKRQKEILMSRGSASDGVYVDLQVVDKQTGKVVHRLKNHKLLNLPYFTNRYTFILDGNEYQLVNQLRTKSGVYTRKRGNEELEASFNLAKGANFKLVMDPKTGVFKVDILHSTLPMFAFLKVLGADNASIQQALGDQLYSTNAGVTPAQMDRTINTLMDKVVRYKGDLGETASKDEKISKIREYFAGTELDEETTAITLGKPFARVNFQAVLAAAQKILRVYKEEDDQDERDNLEFQKVFGPEDIVREVMRKNDDAIRRVKMRLDGLNFTSGSGDRDQQIKATFSPAAFSRPLRSFLATSSISRLPSQINPMEIIDGASTVTRLGEGAISSESAVPEDTRAVNYSYMGTIDPVSTPESGKIGIDNRFSIAAVKGSDNELYKEVKNLKTGKIEQHRLIDLWDKTVGMPDAVHSGSGKPSDMVPAILKGKLTKVKRSALDYQIPSPHHLGSVAVNSLPFVNANQANRIVMGQKHIQQALPLKDRDTRLVEATMDSAGAGSTMDLVGGFLLPKSPVDGTVTKVDDEYVHIKDGEGKTHKVEYENNLPLATKTLLNNEITVKAGDKVKKGEPLGESNFTKDRKLALGKNLKIAYMPYHGLNHEDGIVVSESAAKKMTSVHADRVVVTLDKTKEVDRKKYVSQFPTEFTRDQLSKLDEQGVVKKGVILEKGDPVVLALSDNSESRVNQVLGMLHKSLMQPYRDEAEVYEGNYPSEVVEVRKSGRTITVLLKTEKPLGIGDKLCYDQHTEVLTDRGWVRISEVVWGDKICTLNPAGEVEYQEFTDTHMYPQGGRMYSLVTQQLDVLVTENHKNFVKPRGAEQHSLIPATEMFGKRVRFKKSGNWVGKSPETYDLPELDVKAGQFGNGVRTMPEQKIPLRTYLMLLGAYLSEGSLVNHKASGSYGIVIDCYAEHKLNKLLPSLDSAGISYSLTYRCGSSRGVRIYSKQLCHEFSKYGSHAHLKRIPEHVFSYAKEDLQVLFEWLMWGDGHTKKSSGLPVCYTTVSKQLADDVQRLCLHIGIAANVSLTRMAQVDNISGVDYNCRPSWRVGIVSTKLEPQINHGHSYKQRVSVEKWVDDFREPVFCLTVPNHVMYVRRNGKPYWSGNSGSYGNKGVATKIVADDQMIKDENGEPVDAIFTSAGVMGRINPAQILESTLGKIAQKTGKPYKIENFAQDDYVKFVRDEMKKHGVKDKETVTDPVTGKKVPNVFVGTQHIHKLFKTTDSNYAARGVEGPHDQDDAPTGSGESGPKALGGMEVNALIAHNSRNLLRESSALRSAKNSEFWKQFQYGQITHFPQEKKTFNKFVSVLKQAGVKVDKKDDKLVIGPLTDGDVLKESSGEITNGRRLDAKLNPEAGGLFDPARTGGLKGDKWAHIKLAEPVVNPVFEDSARALLNTTNKGLQELYLNEGGSEIRKRLNAIDVDKELREAEKALDDPKLKGDALDKQVKKVKYLRTLKDRGLKPGDAYTLSVMPVTPPTIRPITIGKTGDLMESDANLLYRDLLQQNDVFKRSKQAKLGDETLKDARKSMQDRVKELTGTMSSSSPFMKNRGVKGALQYISGDQPKHGFFQRKVIYNKMNLTGRATIIPDETLGLDEVGLPEDMAWTMYKPFLVRRLTQQGYSAVQAKEAVDERSESAKNALEEEMEKRPVLVNRAPTLWKYSIHAAKPKLRPGKSLAVNTLWEKGTNADFDGDCSINSVVYRVKANTTKSELALEKDKEMRHYKNHYETQEIPMPFSEDTKIRYRYGLINLKDFPRLEETREVKGNKEIFKVPESVEVLTVRDGDKRWLPVESFHIHKDLEMVEVKTHTSRTIHCSKDHSLVTVDSDLNYTKAVPRIGMTVPRLREPVNGHTEPMRTIRLSGEENAEVVLDRQFGYLNGAFIGDGWVNANHRPWDVMIANTSCEVRTEYEKAVREIAGPHAKGATLVQSPHDYDGHACYSEKLSIYCLPMAEYFREHIALGAGNKHMPDFWYHTPAEFRWGLLAGLIDTDGSVSKVQARSKKTAQVQIAFHTTSRRLAYELVALAHSLDLTATCSFSKLTKSGNEAWVVMFNYESVGKMQGRLKLFVREKANILAQAVIPENLNSKKYTPSLPDSRLRELYREIGNPPLRNKRTGELRFSGEKLREAKHLKTLYNATLQTRKKGLPITKAMAMQIFDLGLPLFEESEFWAKWKSMVLDDSIDWEVVKEIRPIPEITEAYDLTIPPAYTMVTEAGFVIYDTMTAHLPVSDEAIEDAANMLPSKMVFSERNRGNLLYQPSAEPIVGLYKATQNIGKPSTGKVHKFKNVAEAWKAYHDGSLKATDYVEIG